MSFIISPAFVESVERIEFLSPEKLEDETSAPASCPIFPVNVNYAFPKDVEVSISSYEGVTELDYGLLVDTTMVMATLSTL